MLANNVIFIQTLILVLGHMPPKNPSLWEIFYEKKKSILRPKNIDMFVRR
jgi:hypothetical protein